MFESLDELQKRALFKLLMDLIKVDNHIHHKEVLFLGDLQRQCHLDDAELDLVRYITLQQAIDVLYPLEDKLKLEICSLLESLMGVDEDSDIKEKILLYAIKNSLFDNSYGKIISVPSSDMEYASNQIIYLEKKYNQQNHEFFSDAYMFLSLSKSVQDIGLSIFYLPEAISDIKQFIINNKSSEDGKFIQSLEMFFNKQHIISKDIDKLLSELTIEQFGKVILSSYKIQPNLLPEAFLLLLIQEEYIADDDNNNIRVEDFICIDVTNNIKDKIFSFVHSLNKHISAISYEGYYKYLFDFLCNGSKIVSRVVLDDRYNFYLKDLDNFPLKFESSPQARTLYILLLRYGPSGISQAVFDEALAYLVSFLPENDKYINCFDLEEFKTDLLSYASDWSDLIYNTVCIYETLSTKDASKENFLSYIINIIKYRSSLKNYINTSFASVADLSNKEQYFIQFDREVKSYYLQLDISYIYIIEHEEEIKFIESNLWKMLK